MSNIPVKTSLAAMKYELVIVQIIVTSWCLSSSKTKGITRYIVLEDGVDSSYSNKHDYIIVFANCTLRWFPW